MEPTESQFVQMVKAKDLLKHVDLNDVPAKTKEQFAAIRTKPNGRKSITRIAAEKKLLSKRLPYTQRPGIYEGANGKGPSLQESIKNKGVERPLDVVAQGGRMALWNGHHRLAAQLDLDPEAELPVKFHEQG